MTIAIRAAASRVDSWEATCQLFLALQAALRCCRDRVREYAGRGSLTSEQEKSLLSDLAPLQQDLESMRWSLAFLERTDWPRAMDSPLEVSQATGSLPQRHQLMPDATVFSIDVAVAKARNTAYYADPTAIVADDLVDDDLLVARGLVTPATLAANNIRTDGLLASADLYRDSSSSVLASPSTGLAFTNRTFRFLAEPRYPAGVDGSLPPIFSILNDPGINPNTAENVGAPTPASSFLSVVGFDAFHLGRNFRDPDAIGNQNGIVFFPGSTPLYVGSSLSGGFGVSGDGVDQDDVVTASGIVGFAPPTSLRADQVFYRGVRLPFQKFNRNPRG